MVVGIIVTILIYIAIGYMVALFYDIIKEPAALEVFSAFIVWPIYLVSVIIMLIMIAIKKAKEIVK